MAVANYATQIAWFVLFCHASITDDELHQGYARRR